MPSAREVLSYDDWYAQKVAQGDNNFWEGLREVPAHIGHLFGVGKYGKDNYNAYLSSLESHVPSSGRAQDINNMSEREFADYEMREAHKLGVEADSSKYQRAYHDLLKAGLNPRLAIESLQGSGVSASSGYSYSESSSKSQSKSESSSSSFSSSAVVAAILILAGKLITKGL